MWNLNLGDNFPRILNFSVFYQLNVENPLIKFLKGLKIVRERQIFFTLILTINGKGTQIWLKVIQISDYKNNANLI